jgi:hypothetical protein
LRAKENYKSPQSGQLVNMLYGLKSSTKCAKNSASIIYFGFSQQTDNKRNKVLKAKYYICVSSGIKQYIHNYNKPR